MSNLQVDITGPESFHCFRLVFNPPGERRIEIMLHATSLVDLIHQCSAALCEWQRQTTQTLILKRTGLTEEECRRQGLIV